MTSPSIQDVKNYWNENPVHSVEFSASTDLKNYLEQIDSLRWADNERWAREKFYEFGGGKGKRILDAGCGVGVFTRFYARRDFEVHAIDLTPKSVEITQKSLEVFNLQGTISKASVEKIPYSNDYFDYIVSNGVIHHTPDTEKAVEEFYRVLKPGGVASVCVYYQNVLLKPPLWYLIRKLIPLMLVKKQGRENMLSVETPEDLVRTYDGNNTPIAKVYSRKQADELFVKFEHLRVEPHFFPVRFLKFFKTGGFFHKIMDRYFGTLVYYLLKKPIEE
ncbi:MAG: class I SAM-dependent methyltransferase [Nitrospina sp.]|jgi:ubiquinone/menaquinone biosynthesis C-methylase UbiE|nr:class I SAM-dependent methyltransferase [Nitrospina sp.]